MPAAPGEVVLQELEPGQAYFDFYDTIQAEDLMKNATIMASYVYHAAMADERVPRKTVR